MNRRACVRCAEPLGGMAGGTDICGACQRRPPAFGWALAPMLYEFPVDTAIKSLKFRRQLQYLPLFVDWLESAAGDVASRIDAIVPVPLHRLKHGLRGFNQAHELSILLSRRVHIPVADEVRRIRATAPQSDLSAEDRVDNMRGAFSLTRSLGYRRLLIVDDVMTTGETCAELAKTLVAAGADEVNVLTVARARGPG